MNNTALPTTQPALTVASASERGLQLRSLDDMIKFARIVVNSGLAPASFDTPDKVVIALVTGSELGISAVQSLQGLTVTKGRIGIMGDLALALCEATPECEDVKEEWSGTPMADDWTCTVTVKRRGREPRTGSFSVQEARIAGLWGKKTKLGEPTPWCTYPKRMLRYRALGFALRDAFPHVLKGIKTTEELQDYPHDEPKAGFEHARPVTDAPRQPATVTDAEPIAEAPSEVQPADAAPSEPEKRPYQMKNTDKQQRWQGTLEKVFPKSWQKDTGKKDEQGKPIIKSGTFWILKIDDRECATFSETDYLAASDAIKAQVQVTVEPGPREGSWKVVPGTFYVDNATDTEPTEEAPEEQ
jgi:hypothetical protein